VAHPDSTQLSRQVRHGIECGSRSGTSSPHCCRTYTRQSPHGDLAMLQLVGICVPSHKTKNVRDDDGTLWLTLEPQGLASETASAEKMFICDTRCCHFQWIVGIDVSSSSSGCRWFVVSWPPFQSFRFFLSFLCTGVSADEKLFLMAC
jgi:hypothetical protein